jgi:hypothetical protein
MSSVRRVTIITALVAVAIGIFLFVVGIPFYIFATFVCLVVLVGGLIAAIDDPDEPKLPEVRGAMRGGARREVTDAAWRLSESRGRVGAAGAERLRAIAARRLARRGIDLDDPADRSRAEAALGSLAYAVVSRPSTQPAAALRATVRAIDRLGRSDDQPLQPLASGDQPARRTA